MLCELPTGGDPLLCNPLQVVRLAAHPKKRNTSVVFLSDGQVVEVQGTTEQVWKAVEEAVCTLGDALVGGVIKALDEMPAPVVHVEAPASPAERGGRARRSGPRRAARPEPEPEVEEDEGEPEPRYAEPERPVPITPGRGSRAHRVRGGRQRSVRAPGSLPEGIEAAVFEDPPDTSAPVRPGYCATPGCDEKAPNGPLCKDCKPRSVRRLVYREHTGRIEEGAALGSLVDSNFDERHERHRHQAGHAIGDALRGELGGAKGLARFLRQR